MSRLMADQENRGGNNGNPDPDEEDSIMGVNLAEGYRTVNGETLGLFCLSRLSGLSGWSGLSSLLCCLAHTRQTR